jgi:hypothetical protein
MGVKLGLSHTAKTQRENRVLKRIFIPDREEIRGSWGKLHHEELHNLCSSSNII